MRLVITNILKAVGVIIALGVVGYFALPHLVCMDIPKEQKVSDCTNNVLAFALNCEHSPPYQFVLGFGSSHSQTSAFRGEIVIQQNSRTVATIPIGSQDMTACNWLPVLGGYILTWNRTNAGEGLSDFLRRGQSYDVRVAFSEAPPTNSSLWFSSMGRVKW
jgi:hypothetical protein